MQATRLNLETNTVAATVDIDRLSAGQLEETCTEPTTKPQKSPERRYELYAKQTQCSSTREKADQTIKEYKWWAKSVGKVSVREQESVMAYAEYLADEW